MTRSIGAIPIPVFIGLIASLDLLVPGSLGSSLAYNPALLFGLLQTLLFATCAIVAYVSFRTYLNGGSRTILLLGTGTLAWGIANMMGGWLIGFSSGPNLAITVANSGYLFAAIFHLMSAYRAANPVRDVGARLLKSIGAYSLVVIFLAVLTLLAVIGLTPLFFAPGVGSTPLRLTVIMMGFLLFTVSSIHFVRLYRGSRSGILFWYSMALALSAIGIGAFFVARVPGDPIAWAGRTATYLGGIYFVIAVWSAVRNSRGPSMPSSNAR